MKQHDKHTSFFPSSREKRKVKSNLHVAKLLFPTIFSVLLVFQNVPFSNYQFETVLLNTENEMATFCNLM